tara:strand:+ start:1020 stop:1196 length:177 start_codon:yes stop_codon:yes gene_type:complete
MVMRVKINIGDVVQYKHSSDTIRVGIVKMMNQYGLVITPRNFNSGDQVISYANIVPTL